MIYYLADVVNDVVKIGHSTPNNFIHRIRNLNTGNAFPTHIIAVHSGSLNREKTIHKRLSSHRRKGEWFHMNAGVIQHIDGHHDPEYFFDVFESEIQSGLFNASTFDRLTQEYYRDRMLVRPFAPIGLQDWISYYAERYHNDQSVESWRNIVPPDIFEDPPPYTWGVASC